MWSKENVHTARSQGRQHTSAWLHYYLKINTDKIIEVNVDINNEPNHKIHVILSQVCCHISLLYLCVLVVLLTIMPLLQCPGSLQLCDIGEEQCGLGLLPKSDEPKVHAGHTEGHYRTLTNTE